MIAANDDPAKAGEEMRRNQPVSRTSEERARYGIAEQTSAGNRESPSIVECELNKEYNDVVKPQILCPGSEQSEAVRDLATNVSR